MAGKDGKGSWNTAGGRPKGGPGSGYVVACEGGYLYGQRGGAEAIDLDGKSIRKFKGGDMQGLHIRNFFDAVRSRDNTKLNAEVKIGHDSSVGATWPTSATRPPKALIASNWNQPVKV